MTEQGYNISDAQCYRLLNKLVSQYSLLVKKSEGTALELELGMFDPDTTNINGACVTSARGTAELCIAVKNYERTRLVRSYTSKQAPFTILFLDNMYHNTHSTKPGFRGHQ